MEVEYEQLDTQFKCEKYDIEPVDESDLLCFISNVEYLPSNSFVETLIIEIVEDEDELIRDSISPKSEENTPPECELTVPANIKEELFENVETEYFTFKNEQEFKQEVDEITDFTEEQVENESLKDYDVGKLNNVDSESMRKGSNEYVNGNDPDYYPITDSSSGSETDKDFASNSFEEETRHSPVKKHFWCPVCKKSFSRRYHLNRHFTTHSARSTKQQFSCKMCGKRFTWMRNLKNHVEDVHPKERIKVIDEEYQCYHCGMVYSKKQLLVKHMKVHRKKKPFECTVCQGTFETEHTLKWHQVVHSRDHYRCPVCEQSFSKLHNLMSHRFQFHRQGASEDNMERTICPDDESDEGPFLCDICGESFSLMKFIRRHKLSHEKPLQCEVCGNRFTSQAGLLRHLRSHLDKAKFHCDICGKRFLLKSIFLRHKKKHAQEPGSFLCDTCGKLFVTKDLYFQHMRIHRKKAFECHICGQYFSLVEFYNDHMKRHVKRLFKCTLCPLDFTRHDHLKSHMQIHEQETNLSLLKEGQIESTRTLGSRRKSLSRLEPMKVKEKVPHRCKICAKTFPFKSVLFYHEKCHSRVQSFKCPVCSKTLKTNLERHMKTHSEEKPFECSVCKKRFRIRDQMYKHMKTHAVEPPFTCSKCSRGFFSSFALALHRGSHSDGEPYQCKVCDRKFYQMSLLEAHLRQHTGDKPFQCEICEKRFIIKGSLQKHQKKNLEKQSFPCPNCKRQFCFKRDLTAHMKDHNGNCCSFCGKKFHDQYGLKIHIRSHTGDTPFECSVCKRRFTTQGTLNRHAVLHTEDKPFECRICMKSFRRNGHLIGHMERIHGVGRVFKKTGQDVTATPVKKRVIIKVISAKKMKTA